MKKYFAYFLRNEKYSDFCLQEFQSLAGLFGANLDTLYAQNKKDFCVRHRPFVQIRLPNEEVARKIASRSVLLGYIYEIFSRASTLQGLLENIDTESLLPYITNQNSFAFKVHGIGRKIKDKESVSMIEEFGKLDLPWKGKVDLKNPDNTYHVIENGHFMALGEQEMKKQFIFAREVATSYDAKGNKITAKYLLKDRKYIGPTSTDCQLSFLMANQARVTKDSVVYDPFFGTGSIMIACSHFKPLIAYGSDIDIRVLQGYGVGKLRRELKKKLASQNQQEAQKLAKSMNAFTNFQDYGLTRPQLSRMDFLNLPLRPVPLFNAIVCDPPYGIRALSKKSGKQKVEEEKQTPSIKENESSEQEEEQESKTAPHFPHTQKVHHLQIYKSLLEVSNRYLIKGGRLVFLFPQNQSLSPEQNQIPQHDSFVLEHCSTNKLPGTRSRLLVTLIKVKQ